MEIRKLRTAAGTAPLVLAFLLAGCYSAQPRSAANLAPAPEEGGKPDEARQVADVVLGKQAVILAEGDLSRGGVEQLLIADRYSMPNQAGTAVFVTRAVVLEKIESKWSEIFRCDEHLKNPKGYLGGSPLERVSGWHLEFNQDQTKGLEMRFSPADDATGKPASRTGETKGRSVDIRWNPVAKRYQTFDRSHAKYLTELPSLEAQPSQLK